MVFTKEGVMDFHYCVIIFFITCAYHSHAVDPMPVPSHGDCTCESIGHYRSDNVMFNIDCHNKSLTDIPSVQCDTPAVILDVSCNMFTYINNNALSHYPQIEALNFSSSQIGSIFPLAFENLAFLKAVDLSNNDIKFIYPRIFSNNPLLETVNLRNNKLYLTLPNVPFLYSHSVKKLDLSYCSLEMISPEFFSELPNLSVLDLSSNQLSYMSLEVVSPLKKLTVVNIQNNRWACDIETLKLMCWVHKRRHSIDFSVPHKPLLCFNDNGKANFLWSEMKSSKLCKYFKPELGKHLKGEAGSMFIWCEKLDDLGIDKESVQRSWKNNDLLLLIFLTVICIDLFVIIVYIYCFKHKHRQDASNADHSMPRYVCLDGVCNEKIKFCQAENDEKFSQMKSSVEYNLVNK